MNEYPKVNELKCLETPILLLVFNRPDVTAKVFEAVRNARPSRLYIAADGPRENKPGEAERCAEVRQLVTQVDWPCEVKTLFREKNLGCKQAVSGAIHWLFEQEENGIILEDDCLPNPDFFRFCETLLNQYADDERVSVITGNNFQRQQKRGDASYYFSKYNHCWGWASWRRAWQKYQGELIFWPDWRESAEWKKKIPDHVERRYWTKIFDDVHAGKIDSWAYPWTASVWLQGGLTATPNVNLVSNIGFGPDSTHTSSVDSPLAKIGTHCLGEIQHPQSVAVHLEADRYTFDHAFEGRMKRLPYSWFLFPRRAAGKIYRMIKPR